MEDLISALRPPLLACARSRETITYLDLADAARVRPPHRIHNLTLALEKMIEEDHRKGRPLLAAVAVSRGPDQVPGRGFFMLLTRLGRYDGPDRGPVAKACHARELTAAFDFWAAAPDPSETGP